MKPKYAPYLFLLPAIVLLSVFLFLPVIFSFILSLTNFDVRCLGDFINTKFVFLQNYTRLLSDPLFWKATKNTLYFTFVGVPLSIFVSLMAALLLNSPLIKFRNFFRTGYFTPVVTTLVAVAVVWRWLYHPEYGPINYFLKLLDLPTVNWLEDPKWAMPAIIIMAVWKNFGYNMVIFLAGLQAIPQSYYEAAAIDGADEVRSFFYITLPLLKPTTLFVFITTTIGYLQLFAEPHIMTQGGPLNSTLSIVQYMYNHGFKFFNLGYASAISYVLFLMIFCFSVIQMKIGKLYER